MTDTDYIDALMARQRLREARDDRREAAVVIVAILLMVAGVFAAVAIVVF